MPLQKESSIRSYFRYCKETNKRICLYICCTLGPVHKENIFFDSEINKPDAESESNSKYSKSNTAGVRGISCNEFS